MTRLHLSRLALNMPILTALCACNGAAAPSGAGFEVAVAPLSLPDVSKVCYDLRVTDGPLPSSPVIWAEGNPVVSGPSDTGAVCSSAFGNGTGGDITFVGACVASPPDAGETYRTNSVTLWVDSLYDASHTLIDPAGTNGWQNPCPSGCTLTAPCRENADTAVEFNLTILRQANQGFFDIGVNFEDVFCSAKVDCKGADGQPLDLLFRPGTSTRDTTVVSAFACTGGPGASADTILYRNDLKITCGSTTVDLPTAFGTGNAWTTDPTPTDAVFQYAVYAGDETLTCAGQPCNKRYWNVAVGFEDATPNCTLRTRMSASDEAFVNFQTPAATTYPYIDVEVPLTDSSTLICNRHRLNDGTAVETLYTPIDDPEAFDHALDGSGFSSLAVTPSAPAPQDPSSGATTFLLSTSGASGSQNSTFVDGSASPLTVTATGTPTQGTFTPLSSDAGAWSVYLPDRGTGFLTNTLKAEGTTATANIGQNFTLEFWFNGSATSTHGVVVGKTRLHTDQLDNWYATVAGSGTGSAGLLQFVVYYGNTTNYPVPAKVFSSTSRVDDGKWHHCAIVKSSTTYRIFVDGAKELEEVFSQPLNVSNTYNVTLGGSSPNPTGGDYGRTNAWLSNVRITSTAVYTAPFTPPTSPLTAINDTILLALQDGTFKDNGPSHYALTTQIGTPQASPFSPFAVSTPYSPTTQGGSIEFPGSASSYLTTSTAPALALPGDFTAEAWVYLRNTGPVSGTDDGYGGATVVSCTNGGGAATTRNYLTLTTSRTVVNGAITRWTVIYNVTDTQPQQFLNGTSVPQAYTWTHVAVSRQGTALRLFVNGTLEASANVSGTFGHASYPFNVGRLNYSYTRNLDGFVSGLRIVKGSALYTSSFTPAGAPATAVAGTSLLLGATQAGIFDRTGTSPVRVVGDAQVTTTQSKSGLSSVTFDGTGDYLSLPASPFFDFGTADHTIEAWVRWDGTYSSNGRVIYGTGGAGQYDQLGLFNATGLPPSGGVAYATLSSAGKFPPVNTWSHVAVSRQGSTLRMFIDGALVDTETFTGTIGRANADARIGFRPDGYHPWKGHIEDFRITRGVARYTGPFTPPAAPLPDF